MQIRQLNLINLQGWQSPAGWSSWKPSVCVVLIYAAIAVQWFIYLIGMSSKSLFVTPVFLSFCTLLFMLFHVHNTFFPIKKYKKNINLSVLLSQVKLTWAHDMLITPILCCLLDTSIRWLMCICGHSFSFSSFLILLRSWWPENSLHALQRRYFNYFKRKPNPATILPNCLFFWLHLHLLEKDLFCFMHISFVYSLTKME